MLSSFQILFTVIETDAPSGVWDKLLAELHPMYVVFIIFLWYVCRLAFKYAENELEQAKINRDRQYTLAQDTANFIDHVGKSLETVGDLQQEILKNVVDNSEESDSLGSRERPVQSSLKHKD